jgi:putative sterol carrier protein
MKEATADFFEQLGQREHEPLLENVTGRIGIELVNGKRTDRWTVAVDQGDIAVSHKSGEVDCMIRTSEVLFNEMASGTENAMAAVLRGAATVDGNPELLVLFQRLFPGPPAAAASKRATTDRKKRSK